MADRQLTKLIKAAGTRDRFVECYNEAIDESGDKIMTPLRRRTLNHWTGEGFPPVHSPIWILAAVLRMGMTAEDAIAIYPDLAPALELARTIVDQAAGAQASRAA